VDVLAEERRMMGRWSGALWLLGAAVAAACQPLPGVEHDHELLAWILIGALAVYGVACIAEWIPWRRAPMWVHLAAVLAFQPVLGVALWASGGSDSYILPVLVLAMLYSAYFLPGWMAWVGVGALALTYASVLLYTDADEDQTLARVLAFALACEGVTLTLQTLKRRLVAAEQRAASPPPETAEAALGRALVGAGDPTKARRAQDPARVALLAVRASGATLPDALAACARAVVRPGDTIAPAGHDRIAIVAPGAGHDGARRMAQSLRVAAAPLDGAPAIGVSWGVYPDDAPSAAALLEVVFGALDDARH
jgi:hypothetical protein